MLFIASAALVTGAIMLWQSIKSLRADMAKPRWRLRHSIDVIGFAIGFICIEVTSLYAMFIAALWV